VRFRKILQFLKDQNKETLLVVDNIEDAEDEDLDKLMALPANVKVIANSRLDIEGFETHPLDFLSPADCKALFYEFYQGETDDVSVEKIVNLCGSHTLTVELLARTAQAAALPAKAFYDTLTEKGFNLNETIRDRVGTFWHDKKDRERFFNHLLKIFDLSGVTESELHLLTNLAVLPPVYIPVSDFSRWMKLESNEDINNLVRKGWLRRTGMTIFMHQVIQEVIRYRTKPDVEKCNDLIDSLTWKLKCEPAENPLDKKGFVIFAVSVLRHIEEDNQNLATLLNNLSLIYYALGRYETAVIFQLKDVKISEKILEKNHPNLALSYNNLAEIYRTMGRLEEALEFQSKSVNIREKILDENHPDLAQSYNNISNIYQDLGRLEEALDFQLKTVEIFENVFDKDHPYLATSYNNLAEVYREMDKLKKAREFQLKALEIQEKVLDKNHPDLATSYNNIALIYLALKDYESASKYCEKSVAIMQRAIPNGHPKLDLFKRNLEEIKRGVKG
jgi:tetratricopeptide (TPR) repeat protein